MSRSVRQESSPKTSVEVLRAALDTDLRHVKVNAISDAQLRTISERIHAFYDSWTPEPVEAGELRLYVPRWPFEEWDRVTPHLSMAILSAHRVAIDDPLDRWLRPEPGAACPGPSNVQHGVSGHPKDLRWGIRALAELEPLIDAGIVVPIPYARLDEGGRAVWADARAHLEPLLSDWAGSPGVVTPADLDLAERGLVYEAIYRGAWSRSQFLPGSEAEWELFGDRLTRARRELQRNAGLSLSVAPALASAELPFLEGLSARELAKVRQSDEAFADWLSELRTAVRTVRSQPGGEGFRLEAQEALRDTLVPAARRVTAELDRSRALRRNAKRPLVGFVAGAAAMSAVQVGLPPAGVLLASGITALNTWALQSLFPDRSAHNSSVLAKLIRVEKARKR